jgi:signal transduction histidine kinase
VARDLHDGVGQSLNSLLVQIRVAMARGEATPDDLRSFEHGAQEALHTVRTFAYSVRLNAASEELEAARRFAERIVATSGSTFGWVDLRHNRQLGRKVASQVAWVIRESVTNAVRYARAAGVEVRLEDSNGRVRVTVRDDGAGFSPENLKTTPEGRGLGLMGNAERMAEIGGIFTLRSSPGHGTVVLLEVPRYPRRSAAVRARAKASRLLQEGATEAVAGI